MARRINSAHVLKPGPQSRKRNFLYIVTEFVDGQTLTQWMIDNPKPDLETVRGITEQIAKGLRAFHRMEMLHQDLRPDNIMIDRTGTVKIIDFGSTRVAGVVEADAARPRRYSRHRAVHRAGVFPGRERHLALRPVFARRHHLSDADREAALRRAGGADANEGAAADADLCARCGRAIPKCRHGSTTCWSGRCIRIPYKRYRGAVGISARPAPSEGELQQFLLQAAARAQSAGVLEGAVARSSAASCLVLLFKLRMHL